MDFFDIGPAEILLILIVALLLFGPQKVPEIARTLGKAINSFKKSAAEFTTEVTKEIDAVNKAAADATAQVNKEIGSLNQSMAAATQQVNQEINSLSNPVSTGNTEPVPQSRLQAPAVPVEASVPPNPPAKPSGTISA